jgi:ribosomal protein S18 acetylase RimI-like enzyme
MNKILYFYKLAALNNISYFNVSEEDEEWIIEGIDNLRAKEKLGISYRKEPSIVAADLDEEIVYGAIWSSFIDDTYSFDIIVSDEARGLGVGSALIDRAIQSFDFYRDYHDDPKMEVHVVNPILVNTFLKKGFVIEEIIGNEYIMRLKDE